MRQVQKKASSIILGEIPASYYLIVETEGPHTSVLMRVSTTFIGYSAVKKKRSGHYFMYALCGCAPEHRQCLYAW